MSDRPAVNYENTEPEQLYAIYARTRDRNLRDKLIKANLEMVKYLALKFAQRGEPLEDLIQVGSIGLIKALERFEPDKGIKFVSYATPTIVGEIKRYFRDKGWSVKVPRKIKERKGLVQKTIQDLQSKLDHSPTVTEIAQACGLSEEDVLEVMEMGQAYSTLSLHHSTVNEDEGKPLTVLDQYGKEEDGYERIENFHSLAEGFKKLTEREQQVLLLRFQEELSQMAVAEKIGVSQMQVSRIERKALEKLRQQLTS
ncbi:MAG TPA: SigB/SigF/SigG family RNA polymerase sigma factor [Clostridia bacterium]|nr:SigB/SigF/SigG family RNA polymerase sigma factor [Clostridia bacterium]